MAFPYRPKVKVALAGTAKLQDMILFFTECGGGNLGKTKLMKLLYYADFGMFAERGESISKSLYKKYPRGPVAEDALRLLPKMVEAQDLLYVTEEVAPGYFQESFINERHQSPTYLDEPELQQLRSVWNRWRTATTSQIVSASHAEAPWQSVDMYEVIPYELAYSL